MSRKHAALAWDHLTDNDAAILEACFSLYQTREPTTIGSGEILRWFGEHSLFGGAQHRPRRADAQVRETPMR